MIADTDDPAVELPPGWRRYRCRTHGVLVTLAMKAEVVCAQCGQVADLIRETPNDNERNTT